MSATVAEDAVLPWNDHEVKKGVDLTMVSNVKLSSKKTLIIPVPSLTAIYIDHAAKSWHQYWALRKEQKIDTSIRDEVTFRTHSDACDAIALLASSIISAYTAIEAFCNDSIPDDHEYWQSKKDKIILERNNKSELERGFSTGSKLVDILPEIFNVGSPKGKNPVWMSYSSLKKARDALIHAKSKDTRSARLGGKNLWNQIFTIQKPHDLAKDVFDWYYRDNDSVPMWYTHYPKP